MNKEVYKHLFANYGKNLGFWSAFVAEGVRAIIGRVVTVVLLANIVSQVSVGNFDGAKSSIILWAVLTLLSTVTSSIGELLGLKGEIEIYRDLSVEYYGKLTNKDMSFYRDRHAGYLTAMYKQYLDSGLLLVRMIRSDLLRTAISLIFPAIVLLITSWKIGLVMVVLIVSQAAYLFWASAKANKYRLASHEVFRKISGEVADDVTNIVAYKSSGKEKEALQRIKKLAHEETYSFWKRRSTVVFLDFPRSIITTLLVAAAFWLALSASNDLASTVNLLVLTITYMFQVLRNVGDLPQLVVRHDDLITKMQPTLEVMTGHYESINDKESPIDLDTQKGEIDITGLTFRYTDDNSTKHVFKDLDLKILGGEKVGIVGLSGAGKSTLASLIMRFDDIQSGSIQIDGIDIRDIAQSELRSKIAYVPQEPLLFHRSVRENIAYHNEDATDADVQKAAKAAHAHEFLKRAT